MKPQERMPVLFVGHGNPMNAIEDNPWSRAFRTLSDGIAQPKAILAVSAHWYTDGTHVTGNETPETIHDFGGFPKELFDVQYPVAGDPRLAEDLRGRLAAWKASVREDWGIDHGTWSVLRHMYPRADVPVVQLSIDGRASMADHWAIGEALAPLRDQRVLIVGSGNLVHNLPSAFRKWRAGVTETESWGQEFDERIASALDQKDKTALVNALSNEVGHLAHPTPDHYLPVLYATAAAGPDADVSFPVDGFDMGDVSMRSVRFD